MHEAWQKRLNAQNSSSTEFSLSKHHTKMTRFNAYVISLLVLVVFLSCEKEQVAPVSGEVEFFFSGPEVNSGGRMKAEASSLIISVEKFDGESVHDRKNIALHRFGDDFISEPIALHTGAYQLTEFLVLDASGNVIYAAPAENSSLAYLVEDPLPRSFNVAQDQTTKVTPEVLKVEGNSADEFGYATFDFDVVETFTFSTGIMAYEWSTKNFELTEAHIQVTGGGGVLYDADLPAATNEIRVKDGFDEYSVTVTKDGYIDFEQTFTADSLMRHVSPGAPLVIVLLEGSLTEGLIAHYTFNRNAQDQTENNLDGIVHGATPTPDRKGALNSAYRFDGIDDYISVPHNDLLNLSGDFSISLWANVAAVQSPENGINDILRKWNGNAEGYPFSISYLNPLADDFQEDRILYARYDGQECTNSAVAHSPLVTNERWTHVVMIRDGDTIRTYMDNEMTGEVTDPTACATGNTADMTIGTRGNLVRFFKGRIDDIRIYDRVLTDIEIASLYGE